MQQALPKCGVMEGFIIGSFNGVKGLGLFPKVQPAGYWFCLFSLFELKPAENVIGMQQFVDYSLPINIG